VQYNTLYTGLIPKSETFRNILISNVRVIQAKLRGISAISEMWISIRFCKTDITCLNLF